MPASVFGQVGEGESGVTARLRWGVVVSSSYHMHEYDTPLDFWDNAGLLFPSVMIRGELPMSFIEGPLGKKLYLRSGIRYTRLASRINWQQDTANNAQTFSGRFRISQHYLAVPVHFRLVLGRTPVYFLAGSEVGFLLFATKKSETLTPLEFQSSQTEGVGGDINLVHVSLSGGIGVQLSSRLRTFVRYNKGLSNAKKSAEKTVLVTDWQTKEVEVGVEFIFAGRKDP